jgi:Fe-S cluster biogenesis protein NfuA
VSKTKVNREAWLTTMLHTHIAPMMKKHGGIVPTDCKVSVGFPGGGKPSKRIGEAWPRARSTDKRNNIFINPALGDVKRIVDVLVHEAVHVTDDCASGHRGHFKKVARAIGLEGKMTATHAGPELAKWIDQAIAKMPAFDHGALDLTTRKVQTTRLLKLTCDGCEMIVRTTEKWINDVGCPTCACGGKFHEG